MTADGQLAIRRSLARTWGAFFSRFGQLTEVQVKAIPLILAGNNVVVISPAASGKTEAVIAPAIERLLSIGSASHSSLTILYVSPTRALVNDLFRRLSEPMEYLGLRLERKTGDHPKIEEKKLPFLLITTPESLDSLLCRHPRIFKSLRAVVLDEIHLLDNTPRGDQLRVLLERLRLINSELRYYALSATIDDLRIGARYFPGAVVVEVPSEREIEAELLPGGPDWSIRVIERLKQRGARKVLCFFNARSFAEAGVKLFDHPPFSGRVWVHHASLTRQVREEIEAMMNRERIGLICCTSTLELGIDIGDIDAVVLYRPPFNVSSLLQRIGRGNRRLGNRLYMLGVYLDGWERLLFETFIDCARQGELYDKRYTPALSVLPQQIISYCFQRRRIGTTLNGLQRVFQPLVGKSPLVEKVLQHLIREEIIEEKANGIYFLTAHLEKRIESGRIHSNIQEKSFGQYEVIDVTTGQQVGTVFFVQSRFVLAGRSWETLERKEKEKRLFVKPLNAVSSSTKVFEGTGTGGYFYRMAEILKSRIFPGLRPNEFPCFFKDGDAHLIHLLGNPYGGLIAEALCREGKSAVDMEGKLLILPEEKSYPGRFPLPGREKIKAVIRDNLSRFEDSLGSGAFFSLLPDDLQIEDHLLTLDIDGLLEFLDGIQPVPMTPAVVTAQIKEHIPEMGNNG